MREQRTERSSEEAAYSQPPQEATAEIARDGQEQADSAPLREKYRRLQEMLNGYDHILVAFSGGVDSALMLKAAIDSLGRDRVLAATAISPATAEREKKIAQKVAKELGARHLLFSSNEMEKKGYVANGPDRCFHCKSTLYAQLNLLAQENSCDLIANGANADDAHDYRPGQKAASLQKVRSPLLEVSLSKQEIRQLAKEKQISIWDKPASPCLSSRIPYFQPVTAQKLRQVEQAEQFLRSVGLAEFRVRHHDAIARLEALPGDMERLLQTPLREQIIQYFRSLGFLYVALDLNGFQSGSLNHLLQPDQRVPGSKDT